MKRHMAAIRIVLNGRAQRENRVEQSYTVTQSNETAFDVYGTIGAMSQDCHMFIVLSPVCGIVL